MMGSVIVGDWTAAVSDQKICGRVTAAVRFPFFDPYLQSIYVMGPVIVSDWTQSLTKYLREQLQKIQEHYHSGANGPQTSFLLANHNSQADMEHAVKQWGYCTRLAKHMYNVSHVHGKVSHRIHNFFKGKIDKDRESLVYFYRNTLSINCIVHIFVLSVPPQRLLSSQTKPKKKAFCSVFGVFRGRITQILVLNSAWTLALICFLQEGLLDRNETLTWLVELLEKMRNADDTVLKLLLYQIDSVSDGREAEWVME